MSTFGSPCVWKALPTYGLVNAATLPQQFLTSGVGTANISLTHTHTHTHLVILDTHLQHLSFERPTADEIGLLRAAEERGWLR